MYVFYKDQVFLWNQLIIGFIINYFNLANILLIKLASSFINIFPHIFYCLFFFLFSHKYTSPFSSKIPMRKKPRALL